jgi:hypothetical protein
MWTMTKNEISDLKANLKSLQEENARMRTLIAKEVPELRRRVRSLEAAFCHDHVSNGRRNDLCKTCGFDLRDSIHNRLEHADTRTYPHES